MPLLMRILAVDDEADVRMLLEVALGLAPGIELTLAASGEEGLSLAASSRYDAVLLDGLMPGMDGATVCRTLRANPRYASTPIIFLTALAEDAREPLRAAGASGFVRKPFDPFTLAEQLVAIIG
jgi:CheY-like chemotaxis protein